MPTLDFIPEFIGEETSKQFASRQILPFLGLGARTAELRNRRHQQPAPSKRLFTLDAFVESSLSKEKPFFNWTSRPIYDIHQRLLFYDQVLPLAGGNELQVRTAASELLRTPVWSVRAGPVINFDGLINKALSVIAATPNVEAVRIDNEPNVRLICYSYPKLGLLCFSSRQPESRMIVDLWDLRILPFPGADSELLKAPAESAQAMWSPYEFVAPATIPRFRLLWKRNTESMDELPELPERVDDLPAVIAAAGGTIAEACTTSPELSLKPQQNSFFCAAATLQMILNHHLIPRTQDEIATAIGIVFNVGVSPEDQAEAIFGLTDTVFDGELDPTAEFHEAKTEIYGNRPFRTGDTGHARACGGFLVEGGGKEWLYIHDPFPPNRGDVYYEAWEAGFHANYIYVRPTLFS